MSVGMEDNIFMARGVGQSNVEFVERVKRIAKNSRGDRNPDEAVPSWVERERTQEVMFPI